MIRVITEFVANPSVLILCDHAHCGAFASQELPDVSNGMDAIMKQFVAARGLEGWAVGIDRQLCNGHAMAVRNAQTQRPLIHVPGSLIT